MLVIKEGGAVYLSYKHLVTLLKVLQTVSKANIISTKAVENHK